MKYLLILLAMVFSVTAGPVTTFAKDKHKDDYSKNLADELKALSGHYDMMKDRVKNLGQGDRRLWDGLHDIRSNIDGIYDQANSGRYDGRDLYNQIQRAHDDLRRLQEQIDYNNKRRGGGYYRPY